MRTYDNFEYDYDLVEVPPSQNTSLIVVIPVYNEPEFSKTLDSLFQTGQVPGTDIEIICVVNDHEMTTADIVRQNDSTYTQIEDYSKKNDRQDLSLYPIRITGGSEKTAGVGLARKIGMDEAAKRLLKTANKDGVICCLDADVEVLTNYFIEIFNAFEVNDKWRAANVYFEHDLDEDLEASAKIAIIQYESHLRYHVGMQRILNLPFAFYTIGSSMTVKASAYFSHFGMNKRQAGEDFYFLHKFIKSGYFGEINSTCVKPSARFSDRVPFGTGQMVEKLSGEAKSLMTYNYRSYEALASLTSKLEKFYNDFENYNNLLNPEAQAFFGDKLRTQFITIKNNTGSFKAFRKRFYQWFDAFQMIKYLHFCRDNFYQDIEINKALDHLLLKLEINANDLDQRAKLELLRNKDQRNNYPGYRSLG